MTVLNGVSKHRDSLHPLGYPVTAAMLWDIPCNFPLSVWVWNLVSHIMGRTKTKCIWEQDDEDICTQPYHLYSSPYITEMIKSKEKHLCRLGMTQVR